jgi:hypothetical protein
VSITKIEINNVTFPIKIDPIGANKQESLIPLSDSNVNKKYIKIR